jgi:hypothetical protein
MGLAPAMDKSLSEELALPQTKCDALLDSRCISCTPKTTGLSAELYPFRSPLLRVSLLVSFPPLIYMLKLSG